MRDWSVKWHIVEPKQGAFDFSRTDPQIDRVLAERLNLLMLFPFPATPWCNAADMDAIRKETGGNKYRQERAVVACAPEDLAPFRNYISRSARHYRNRIRYYEIMNEPLYTTYAVPARFGYKMADYVQLLRDAHEAIKAQQPSAQVVGGIGTWAGRHWVHDFIKAGGLRWCDAMDIHLYPTTIPPELYEDELAEAWRMMQSRGEAKPIWLTEFGCYADDDPYKTPDRIGDSAASRAHWPSERDAAEALVKSSAVFLTYGLQKIFFHCGTCGPLNGRNGTSIFFEYGGAPRKMYAALNALANLLGPEPKPLSPRFANDRLRAHLFKTRRGIVAVVWQTGEKPVRIRLPAGVTARDMMGNAHARSTVQIATTPTYLLCSEADRLRELLSR